MGLRTIIYKCIYCFFQVVEKDLFCSHTQFFVTLAIIIHVSINYCILQLLAEACALAQEGKITLIN
jgi:hypothetical protein